MNRKRVRSKLGDVFAIPIDRDRALLGQVVGSYKVEACRLVVVFDGLASMSRPMEVPVKEVVRRPLVLVATVFDALLYSGDWPIVANGDPIELDPPAFKVSRISGGEIGYWVEDYSGKRRRRASAEESDSLSYRTLNAPEILQRAVRALSGKEPWIAAFDEMLPGSPLTSRQLFSAGEEETQELSGGL